MVPGLERPPPPLQPGLPSLASPAVLPGRQRPGPPGWVGPGSGEGRAVPVLPWRTMPGERASVGQSRCWRRTGSCAGEEEPVPVSKG